MKIFEISVPIVSGYLTYVVSAGSEEEAKEKLAADRTTYEEPEYSVDLDLDTNNWEIEEQ